MTVRDRLKKEFRKGPKRRGKKFGPGRYTWRDARNACHTEGGSATHSLHELISSEEEVRRKGKKPKGRGNIIEFSTVKR